MTVPILAVRDLCVEFEVPGEGIFRPGRTLRAVDNVSFELQPGEALGVVGESGCGKSTLARAVMGLVPAASGVVSFMSETLRGPDRERLRKRHRELQIVFQDPLDSLNPRMTAGEIIAEPLQTHHRNMPAGDRRARVLKAMLQVGLSEDHVNRYPHEFSGGQCQRVGIARALVLEPKLIICDEPVSALDVSVQAQIINLLMRLRDELRLTLVFIAHDLSVIRLLCERVMVMYLGRVVELAPSDSLFRTPAHPYTRALMAAVPVPDPRRQRAREPEILTGEVPSPINPPSGCAFRTRCAWAIEKCAASVPALRLHNEGEVACHRVAEVCAGRDPD